MTLPIRALTDPKHPSGTNPELPAERESPASGAPLKDPLIAQSWDYVLYVGLFAIAIALISIIGLVSSRAENALYFALALSALLIAFLLTL